MTDLAVLSDILFYVASICGMFIWGFFTGYKKAIDDMKKSGARRR